MEKSILIVKTVKEVKGFIPAFNNPNRYNGSNVITRTNEFKALFITGEIDGQNVVFYSPTVEITKTSGMLNYLICKENNWFKVQDGEQYAVKGHPMFDGGKTPNISIDCRSKVVILVSPGDVLPIKYNIKERREGCMVLSRVQVVK